MKLSYNLIYYIYILYIILYILYISYILYNFFLNYISWFIFLDTQEKIVEFTILWLPGRFPQLWIYIFVGIFILAFSICMCISNYCTKSHAYNRMSSI